MANLILQCACGKRLEAPGAKPGRVGRCPSCGAMLRVPEPAPRPVQTAAPARPRREETPADRDSPARPRRSSRPNRAGHPEDPRLALARPPRSPETGVLRSFAYPLWDTPGLLTIVVLTVLLLLATLVTAFIVGLLLRSGTQPHAMPLLPFLIGCLGVYLYAGQVLSRYLEESALGEAHHPRWPELSIWGLGRDLARGLWLLLMAGIAGGVPAYLVWAATGRVGVAAAMLPCLYLSVLVLQTGWLAVVVREDIRAAFPWRLVATLFGLGSRGLVNAAIGCGLLVALLGLWWLAATYTDGLWALVTISMLWGVFLYCGLVMARLVGLNYYHRRQRLGWFIEREHWGAR